MFFYIYLYNIYTNDGGLAVVVVCCCLMSTGLGSWWRRIATGRAFRSWRRRPPLPPRRPSAVANCSDGDGGGGGGGEEPTDRPSGSDWVWCPSTNRPSWAADCPSRHRLRRPATSAEAATNRWRACRPIGVVVVVVGGSSSSIRDAVVVVVAGADVVGPWACWAAGNRHRRRTPDWAIRLPIRMATFAASMPTCWRSIRRLRPPVEPLSSSSCIYSFGSGTKFSPKPPNKIISKIRHFFFNFGFLNKRKRELKDRADVVCRPEEVVFRFKSRSITKTTNSLEKNKTRFHFFFFRIYLQLSPCFSQVIYLFVAFYSTPFPVVQCSHFLLLATQGVDSFISLDYRPFF